MSMPSWYAVPPVNGSVRTPKLEVTTPWTGQTVGVEAMRDVRFENSPSSIESRDWTRAGSIGTPGPPTPLATFSDSPATIASRRVRVSNSESCRETPSKRLWRAAAVERRRAFSATAWRYCRSRRAEAKNAQPKATAATKRAAMAAAETARKRVEMVSLRKRARACGTKMIVLYFFTGVPRAPLLGGQAPSRLHPRV